MILNLFSHLSISMPVNTGSFLLQFGSGTTYQQTFTHADSVDAFKSCMAVALLDFEVVS